MLPAPYWIVAAVTIVAVVVCVSLHYEALKMISNFLPTPKRQHRRRVVFLILCLMVIHCIEIWIFGLANYALLQFDGFGDLVPEGPIRFLTGMEAIAGLTFITWSASFTIVDMMNFWDEKNSRD